MQLQRIYFVLPENYFGRNKILSVNSLGPHFSHSGRAPNKPHEFVGSENEIALYRRALKKFGMQEVDPAEAVGLELSPSDEVDSADGLSQSPAELDGAPAGVQDADADGDVRSEGLELAEGSAALSDQHGDDAGRGAGSAADAGNGQGCAAGAVEAPVEPKPPSKRAARRAAKKAADEAAAKAPTQEPVDIKL